MRIAVDAMGGDYAPRTVVAGVVEAARLHRGAVEVWLVGREDAIAAELVRLGVTAEGLGIRIVAASEVVGMDEAPGQAIRRKRDSSLRRAADLMAKGEVDAVVSAGNTGAVVGIMHVVVGSLAGVDRPAVAALMPNLKGRSLLLDVGATVDCKPDQLYQFAVMGHTYIKEIFGIAEPSVGLLSIGEEASKGNELTKEAYKLLKSSSLRFIGNVEGRDIYLGKADVIVCDGFVGNLVLKSGESMVEALDTVVRDEYRRSLLLRLGVMLAYWPLTQLRKRWDYTEVGGAPLLGLNGTCIICHGRSDAKSIRNAIGVARDFVAARINQRIEEKLRDVA